MDYHFEQINQPLLAWYQENKRNLPWRDEPSPYHVWVSEIMLQQTRVEAVKTYYYRFMNALPDIKSLANAKEDQLLKLWEGLGYYNRVRNMKKAAIMVEEEYGGRLPDSYEELQKLPGIGRYTAGAIASIAYARPVASVDGNLLRVAMRLAACDKDIARDSVKKEVEKVLTNAMDQEHPGEWNQALMDLGATICIPKGKPHCEICPLKRNCLAREKGLEEKFPVKNTRIKKTSKEYSVIVFRWRDRYAIEQRPEQGLLSSLWQFPMIEGKITPGQLDQILEYYGLDYEMVLLGEAKHVFSHIVWKMNGFLVEISPENELPDALKTFAFPLSFIQNSSAGEKVDFTRLLWKTREEIEEKYSIPSAFSFYRNQVFR